MKTNKEMREYFKRIGRRGGRAKTPAKRQSSARNLENARAVKEKSENGT